MCPRTCKVCLTAGELCRRCRKLGLAARKLCPESLLVRDDYMLLADYESYVECQERVSGAYRDRTSWTRMSIVNCASVGRFSSDRSVREYCRDIWNVTQLASPPR